MSEQELNQLPEDQQIVVGRDISNELDSLYTDAEESSNDVIEHADDVERYGASVDDLTDRSPFGVLKFICEKQGMKIKDAPSPGCRKCYGRGFIGFDAKHKYPIPCGCIFFAEDKLRQDNQSMSEMLSLKHPNREMRRRLEKQARKNRVRFTAPEEAPPNIT